MVCIATPILTFTIISTLLSYLIHFCIASAHCGKTESQDHDRNTATPNIGMYTFYTIIFVATVLMLNLFSYRLDSYYA
jgi:hypothetical protein